MTQRFVMVCEAEADFRTASRLADRVVCEQVDWIPEDSLDSYRQWCGFDDALHFLTWTEAKNRAKAARLPIHGQFDGKPGEADAYAARRALRLIRMMNPQPDGVCLIRDDDRKTERGDGLEQARKENTLACPIVIGLAHLKRECWVLVGFTPGTAQEAERLADLLKELSFHPCKQPERLTGKEGETRCPKRIVKVLTNDDPAREEACWAITSLENLRSAGQVTGLAEYLDEVKQLLIPLFTGHTPQR
jgi:hypothetical protein